MATLIPAVPEILGGISEAVEAGASYIEGATASSSSDVPTVIGDTTTASHTGGSSIATTLAGAGGVAEVGKQIYETGKEQGKEETEANIYAYGHRDDLGSVPDTKDHIQNPVSQPYVADTNSRAGTTAIGQRPDHTTFSINQYTIPKTSQPLPEWYK